jgi:hypothetical protein
MADLTHEELRLSLGSYVLGSLSPADRAATDAHLPGCRACREELASYAALPAMMSRVHLDQVRQPAPPVPSAVLNRALSTVATEQERKATQLRWWRTATVLAAAVCLLVALLLGRPAPNSQKPSAPDGVPLVAAAGVSASGSASLEPKPWGTAITLQLDGLPQGGGFTAWVTAANGSRSIAASWSPTPNGHASLSGAAAIPTTQLASLHIMQGQTTLLTLTGPR